MRFPIQHPRSMFNRKTVRDDAMSGLVLGVESVPDGLASGLLAGVNPVAGLYAYLYGLLGGALFSSTSLMAVQGTGAMAIIVVDANLSSADDPLGALYAMTILTGIVMIVAGYLRLGMVLRFVSNSVMAGFIGAVGVNIVLGQLGDLTGYSADGSNRLARTVNLIANITQVDLATITVGIVTMVLIVVLQKTRLGAMGLVVAVFLGSALAAALNAAGGEVALVSGIATIPNTLPFPGLPSLDGLPNLILPAVSMAFVGLVQGAGVSAGFPNSDGSPSNQSQDFVAQGAGNVASGLFQGMPVGGSMSATSLVSTAGAKNRQALFMAAGVMAAVILALGGLIESVAMPSLAALLMVVGYSTVNINRMQSVARTGTVPLTVMTITFVLTLVIRLQYSVLVGVGISVILFVIQQSAQLRLERLVYHSNGLIEEVDAPYGVPSGEVVMLRPYGQLFFATASTLRGQLPAVTADSNHSVVILRLRGIGEAGVTLIDVLVDYADKLAQRDCRLMIVTDNAEFARQFKVAGAEHLLSHQEIYRSTKFLGEALKEAHADALAWITDQRGEKTGEQAPEQIGGTAERDVAVDAPDAGLHIDPQASAESHGGDSVEADQADDESGDDGPGDDAGSDNTLGDSNG